MYVLILSEKTNSMVRGEADGQFSGTVACNPVKSI